ncbi:hypothetical protein, partial [Streptomyces anulatus]|uniref:hypothetical protein n=1 Tax=Streptomyces anulatus TaxID=1892 RepID=UPI00347F44B8
AMRNNMRVIKYLARELNSAALVLHHCAEGEALPEGFPPPRRTIQGKVSQLPALILTVANDGAYMRIACVKNRYGQADPSAQTYVTLKADLARMSLSEPAVNDYWSQFKGN